MVKQHKLKRFLTWKTPLESAESTKQLKKIEK